MKTKRMHAHAATMKARHRPRRRAVKAADVADRPKLLKRLTDAALDVGRGGEVGAYLRWTTDEPIQRGDDELLHSLGARLPAGLRRDIAEHFHSYLEYARYSWIYEPATRQAIDAIIAEVKAEFAQPISAPGFKSGERAFGPWGEVHIVQ